LFCFFPLKIRLHCCANSGHFFSKFQIAQNVRGEIRKKVSLGGDVIEMFEELWLPFKTPEKSRLEEFLGPG
jgi:hypothetical protein